MRSGRIWPPFLVLAWLWAFTIPSAAAGAGDSSAALAAGGLRLTENPDIRLREEDLFLSRGEVRASSLFENGSDAEIRMLVAFPLPALDLAELAEKPAEAPVPDPVNFVGFEARADGNPVKPLAEMRASRNGVDVSELLIRYGVPLSRFDARLYPALLGLGPPARAELTAMNLAEWDSRGNVQPLWTTQTVFYWPQSFPANGTLRIEHRYKPVVGQGVLTVGSVDSALRGRYCMDDEFLAALRERLAAAPHGLLRAYRLRYALTADTNRTGPIGRFRLTIDTGDPQTLMAVCVQDLKKTGPARFTLERADFTPARDLDILFLEEDEAG